MTIVQGDLVDWSNVEEGVAERIFQLGDTYLQQQTQIAMAADMRAITASSIFATLSTAILGAALTMGPKADFPLFAAGIAASTACGMGAAFGFWAARPITFYTAGNHPSSWWEYRHHPLAHLLGAESEGIQHHIEANEVALRENAEAFRKATVLATSAPAIALFVWWVITSYPW